MCIICIAVLHGDLPGVEILQQRDAKRDTPITIAQKQGHASLAEQLEKLRLEGIHSSSSFDMPGINNSSSTADRRAASAISTVTVGSPCPEVGGRAFNTAGAGRGFGRGFGRGRGGAGRGLMISGGDNNTDGATHAAAEAEKDVRE